jgi:hypothetical protein
VSFCEAAKLIRLLARMAIINIRECPVRCLNSPAARFSFSGQERLESFQRRPGLDGEGASDKAQQAARERKIRGPFASLFGSERSNQAPPEPELSEIRGCCMAAREQIAPALRTIGQESRSGVGWIFKEET